MKVLLDTCVLSELNHPHGSHHVRQAVMQIEDDDLFLSVISIGEIIKGIMLLDDGRRKSALSHWVQNLIREFGERILPVDLKTTDRWGQLTAAARKQGLTIPTSDGLIASTALCHDLKVMTRNISDFIPAGVGLINPWHD